MTKQEATKEILDRVDYIIEEYETPDFYEFLTSIGGDKITYRVYKKTGMVVEKWKHLKQF